MKIKYILLLFIISFLPILVFPMNNTIYEKTQNDNWNMFSTSQEEPSSFKDSYTQLYENNNDMLNSGYGNPGSLLRGAPDPSIDPGVAGEMPIKDANCFILLMVFIYALIIKRTHF